MVYERRASVDLAISLANEEKQRRIDEEVTHQEQETGNRRKNSILAGLAFDEEKARRVQEQAELDRRLEEERMLSREVAKRLTEEEQQRRVEQGDGDKVEQDRIGNAIRASAAVMTEASNQEFQEKWFERNTGQSAGTSTPLVQDAKSVSRLQSKVDAISSQRQEQRRLQRIEKDEEARVEQQRIEDWEQAKADVAEEQVNRTMAHLSGADKSRVEMARFVSIAMLVETSSDEFLHQWYEHNFGNHADKHEEHDDDKRTRAIERLIDEALIHSDRIHQTRLARKLADAEKQRRVDLNNENDAEEHAERQKNVAIAQAAQDEEKNRRVREIEAIDNQVKEQSEAEKQKVKGAIENEQLEKTQLYLAGRDKQKMELTQRNAATVMAEGSSEEFQAKWMKQNHERKQQSAGGASHEDEEEDEAIVRKRKVIQMEEREKFRRMIEEKVEVLLEQSERRRRLNAADVAEEQERTRRIMEIEKDDEKENELRKQTIQSVRDEEAAEKIRRTNLMMTGQEQEKMDRARQVSEAIIASSAAAAV